MTIKEVIDTARLETGREISPVESERRPGDPAALIGSLNKIKKMPGWEPKYNDLPTILDTAWVWHKKLNSLKD